MAHKLFISLCCIFGVVNGCVYAQVNVIRLDGVWRFRLDTSNTGEYDAWYTSQLDEQIHLPGSTDENKFGTPASSHDLSRLTRIRKFYGPAWYQKEVDIPEGWAGKHIELMLERVMWESKVWVDDHLAGMQESICTPHRYNLSPFMKPGRHRITIRIDNRYKYNIGVATSGRMGSPMWTMAVTDESQTTWNGVIGKMQLRMTDPIWIERFDAYTDIQRMEARVVVIVKQLGNVSIAGELTVDATGNDRSIRPVTTKFRTKGASDPVLDGHDAVMLSQVSGPFYSTASETLVELKLPLDDNAKKWDEFSPYLYTLRVNLAAQHHGDTFKDEKSDVIGIRQFTAAKKQFQLNGRTVFLRGNQDNCVHPLTGYPPIDKKQWITFLEKYKNYGLNHVRFHSWCPPEEAFSAADELGLILQIEAPMWDGYGYVGRYPDRAAFIRYEAERILDEYGNHPSFCMFSIGNELGDGTELYLQYLVEVLRDRDNRHLYTCASAPASNLRNDDYLVGANGITGDWACSISATCFRGLKKWKGQNNGDVRTEIETMNKPLIAHEIGQHTSFPDFYSWFNAHKYTGPLKAYYIDTFKTQFEKLHTPTLGPLFASASGALQLLLYKAEIEVMLRTPNLSGFHLNGISDYPGEGVALIGVLDAMMDNKGIASPETFREFCSETVPLARINKQMIAGGDMFEANVEVRHHGASDLKRSTWLWKIADESGKAIRQGTFAVQDIPTGTLSALGNIKSDLPSFETAQELTLTVWMDQGKAKNSWHFWVFDKESNSNDIPKPGIVIADRWNEKVKSALRKGVKVLLLPSKQYVAAPVDAEFFTVFWSKGATSKDMGAMGVYCDSSHPSLARFPTRSHADWQWYDLMTGSYSLNINRLPFAFQPIVHLIDFFKTNDRLSMLMEASVGKGQLVVCTLNLGSKGNRSLPQQQMLNSLVNYMASENFRPPGKLSFKQLDDVL
jgi:hypothetical protein